MMKILFISLLLLTACAPPTKIVKPDHKFKQIKPQLLENLSNKPAKSIAKSKKIDQLSAKKLYLKKTNRQQQLKKAANKKLAKKTTTVEITIGKVKVERPN